MPHTLTTSDGRNHTVFDEQDILRLVEEYAGRDVRGWIEDWMIKQAKTLEDSKDEIKECQDEIDRLQDHQRLVLTDMYEEASWLLKLTGEPRPKRSDIRACVEKIWSTLKQEV